MSRPLRIEYPGALYHVTSRGNARAMIFLDDADRHCWDFLVGEMCRIFRFSVFAYCQMGNHYHLLVRTNEGKLSRGMRYLNGEYSRHFNLSHDHVGHVLQGRYKAIVCQDERYLHTLSRYIVLNPLRAGLVSHPGQWEWSSYRATMGRATVPIWLDTAALLKEFGSDPARARACFEAFVLEGISQASPLASVRNQILLGDAEIIRDRVKHPNAGVIEDLTYPQRQLLVKPIEDYFQGVSRDKGMADAFASLSYTMGEIARFCGVSTKTVSRAVQKHAPRDPL